MESEIRQSVVDEMTEQYNVMETHWRYVLPWIKCHMIAQCLSGSYYNIGEDWFRYICFTGQN